MRVAPVKFLLLAVLSLVFCLPCLAQKNDSAVPVTPNPPNTRLYPLYPSFDIQTSDVFFRGLVDNPSIHPLYFPLKLYYPLSVAPEPDYRPIEEKLADSVREIIPYRGGEYFCEAVQLGLDFFTYSKDVTTYGNHRLYTGLSITGHRSSFVRGGLFYNF
ncbi:MAG: hypothetical protein A3F83_16005 [Candidatus Glassbacteria bacterium RIFCSPLOWO2_12_FULL_58_11]|uniref:Uncharacterized protein n=1 Tax=Candidatus Glassbacteria bacterium RIFCSPLOWO2_12_FULL_58_11 TaxID=1817867 RepID=A0A1F5Z1C1_9BACT|nr:MAG: hypothetical protein A3F83_16005 [Candidatus Glassbacteria bacterium RIFCSPLOWO2_12_FULL_58_11]